MPSPTLSSQPIRCRYWGGPGDGDGELGEEGVAGGGCVVPTAGCFFFRLCLRFLLA
jgi:hypothetical protein